jgi:hypothetical protein
MARPTYTTSAKPGSSRWPLRFTTVVALMLSSARLQHPPADLYLATWPRFLAVGRATR